jgi:hypothetical protein
MPSVTPPDTYRRLLIARRVSRAGAIGVACVGVIAFVGWILDNDGLKTLFLKPPVTVKTNTAVGFVAAGVA